MTTNFPGNVIQAVTEAMLRHFSTERTIEVAYRTNAVDAVGFERQQGIAVLVRDGELRHSYVYMFTQRQVAALVGMDHNGPELTQFGAQVAQAFERTPGSRRAQEAVVLHI